MGKTLRFILGDQLSHNISSLKDIDPDKDIIFMCEVWDETRYVKHHKKKIAFLFSAMRHFSNELKDKGYEVDYVHLDDKANTGSFTNELKRAVNRHDADEVIVTFPGEYRVLEEIKSWSDELGIYVGIRDDDRFLATREEFADWAKGRKGLTMEYFYREMRRKHNILMDANGDPEGGEWNYDKQNRETLPDGVDLPSKTMFQADDVTEDVLKLVEEKFDNHFGDLRPFNFAVTRAEALRALNRFIEERLPNFGKYQDAMKEGKPFLFHSHISAYLNSGLLTPAEILEKAEAAYKDGHAPLNAVEGFIRQILGWREFIRGMYWHFMPDYEHKNFFHAQRKLPDFFWTANTKMNCMKQCIKETKENAYAHHIQRLMVIGNFCLLAGLSVEEVNEWYLIVYADAYQWVELPNVTGMILYADGGLLASKPYAASGSYINKMSDYCKNCDYKVSEKTGEAACPFNYLYWDFLDRNEDKLKGNHRLSMIYKSWEKRDSEIKKTIRENAAEFLKDL